MRSTFLSPHPPHFLQLPASKWICWLELDSRVEQSIYSVASSHIPKQLAMLVTCEHFGSVLVTDLSIWLTSFTQNEHEVRMGTRSLNRELLHSPATSWKSKGRFLKMDGRYNLFSLYKWRHMYRKTWQALWLQSWQAQGCLACSTTM